MDRISKARRSANMAAIRSVNTGPELAVRTALFRAGLRYRLHRRDLPGRPDIVFPGRKIVLFVHGCFFHGCRKCVDGRRVVRSNTGYWTLKILSNRERDARNRKKLRRAGWQVLEIWECEAADARRVDRLIKKISAAGQTMEPSARRSAARGI
jgi:DNA mismatch endonuclease, patch repair protein